jgi:hypothetical protein
MLSVGLIVIEHFMPQPQVATTVYVPPTSRNNDMANAKSSPVKTDTSAPVEELVETPRLPDYYLAKLDKKLAELKVKRAEMLSTYTELHPDVVLIDRKIEELKIERASHLRSDHNKNHEYAE